MRRSGVRISKAAHVKRASDLRLYAKQGRRCTIAPPPLVAVLVAVAFTAGRVPPCRRPQQRAHAVGRLPLHLGQHVRETHRHADLGVRKDLLAARGVTPCKSNNVAAVCRAACGLKSRIPATASRSLNVCQSRLGSIGLPLGWVNTSPHDRASAGMVSAVCQPHRARSPRRSPSIVRPPRPARRVGSPGVHATPRPVLGELRRAGA